MHSIISPSYDIAGLNTSKVFTNNIENNITSIRFNKIIYKLFILINLLN